LQNAQKLNLEITRSHLLSTRRIYVTMNFRDSAPMKICVFGLWHLGSVIAACLAEHFPTVGVDPDPKTMAALQAGRAPVSEPGLDALIQSGLSSGRLRFTGNLREAVEASDIV
jgi:UDPglucose 6-dehydrogenase